MRQLCLALPDDGLRSELLATVRRAGYGASSCEPRELLARIAAETPAALMVDVGVPDGMALLSRVRGERPELPLIALAAAPDRVLEATRNGAQAFLRKPFCVQELEAALARVSSRQLHPLDDGGYPTVEPAMQGLLLRIKQAAQSEAPLWLEGESGTGKLRLARAVHRWSGRSDENFQIVSCSALDAAPRRSGHRLNAFGISPEATGTVVLDGVAELAGPLQQQLLDWLERQDETPEGRRRLRLVSTARRAAEACEGLRAELALRLGVLSFHIPPLRERRRDIELLARSAMERFARENGSAAPSWDESLRSGLRSLPLRGNVRELESLMRRAVLSFPGQPVDFEALLSARPPRAERYAGRPLNLRELERDAVVRSLESTGGNRKRAAEALGISERTLRNKIRLYALR